LYGIIVPLRAPKSAHAYASIWDTTYNQSPLRVITEAQTRKLDALLPREVMVRHAMRYGKPSIGHVLDEMKADGCGRIVVLPLYPQYAGATVGTVVDEVARWQLKQRWVPTVQFVPPYYDHALYINALANSVREEVTGYRLQVTGKKKRANRQLSTVNPPQVLIASFHGMPLKACHDGDVYYCHCHKTARLLAKELGMTFCKTIDEVVAAPQGKPPLLLSFQSRFGKAEWLKPYFANVLEELPKHGITNVQVISPAFAADCVETLEELALAGRDSFIEAGGQSYFVVPCLNDSDASMDMLRGLVEGLI
jgi:ferrochelatase